MGARSKGHPSTASRRLSARRATVGQPAYLAKSNISLMLVARWSVVPSEPRPQFCSTNFSMDACSSLCRVGGIAVEEVVEAAPDLHDHNRVESGCSSTTVKARGGTLLHHVGRLDRRLRGAAACEHSRGQAAAQRARAKIENPHLHCSISVQRSSGSPLADAECCKWFGR